MALGHQWLRTARVAHEKLEAGGTFPAAHYEAKLAVARFYFERMMPRTASLYQAITAGGESVLGMALEAF